MKPHDNPQDAERQRNIEEQEQAMAQLLQRVMQGPLAPLHDTIAALRAQIAAVEKASIHAAQSVEAGLSEALEGQGKRLNRHVGDVADGVDSLKEELAGLASALEKRHTGQVERDQHLQEGLAGAGDLLARLDVRTAAADDVLAATAANLAKVDATLGAVSEQQQVVAGRISQELGGLGGKIEQQQAHVDAGLGKTSSALEQLDAKAAATIDGLAAAAGAVAAANAALGALREQEQAGTGQLSGELNGGLRALAQQLDRQQVGLGERIDGVQPALAPHFDTLATTIDNSSKQIADRCDTLTESQKALVTATVQEQLALQLAPFQARTTWLFAVCGLSFVSTLVLLGMQFIH